MSVSPPPGGALKLCIAVGTGPGLIGRKLWPPSTEPNQTLRCVPVPVGPLTKTRSLESTPTSGSPNVWIGSTTEGVSKRIGAAAAGAAAMAPSATASTTRALLATTPRDHTRDAGGLELERGRARPAGDGAGGGAGRVRRRRRRAAGDPRGGAGAVARRAGAARIPARACERPARHITRAAARRPRGGARATRSRAVPGRAAVARAPPRGGRRRRVRAARPARADLLQGRAGQGAHARGDVRAP